MRRSALVLTLAAFAIAAAQQPRTYSDPTGNIQVSYSSGIVRIEKKSYRFDVTRPGGKVRAIVKDEGLDFSADRVQGALVPAPFDQIVLERATASGGVRLVKTGGGSRAELTGSTATFTRAGSGGSVAMAGPVRLTNFNSAKRQSLTARGSSATAQLGVKGAQPLRAATLRGPVAVDAAQPGGDEIHATGSRLDIDNTSKPAKITLSGGVHVWGPKFGDARVDRVILFLDAAGAVTAVETKAGSE